ncbi:MAG: sigma-70 family RNA polymerase sigma factor [Acidobacteria bacterium]|nr:sigma-70 family RNA polymerase sigma factor [Acidobacteriota bacterium]
MDSTLLAFLQTTDADDRERLLSKLILEQAAPSVRQVLRYRLRFYIGKGGGSPANPDAEDLYHDVIAKLVKILNEVHAQRKNLSIKDFRQYATRVAINACNDYLRSKYPSRTRLKDQVRDTLERHPDFDIWRSEQGESVCGFVAWRNEMKPCVFYERVRSLEEQPELIGQELFARMDSQKISLTNVIAGVFEWVRCPIELESLVNATAVLLDIKEQQFQPLDDDSGLLTPAAFEGGSRYDEILEERAALQKLWDEVCRMPANQRETFIFSFANSKGDDLLSLLFNAGVITPSKMAEELDLSLDRLMMIWKEIPMRNVDIAVLLGVERQQVNKWRHRAMKQLEKRLLRPK